MAWGLTAYDFEGYPTEILSWKGLGTGFARMPRAGFIRLGKQAD